MKLRTFEGEPVRGKITTDPKVSPDGGPVLLVDGEPFFSEEAEFLLEFVFSEQNEREKRHDL